MTMPNQTIEYTSTEMKMNGEVFARKENGKWVVRSQHYSPANYGGVHVPQATDFDN